MSEKISKLRMSPRPLTTHSIDDLVIFANDQHLVEKAAKIYKTHGCCVIRGLNKHWLDAITHSIEQTVTQSRNLLHDNRLSKITEGWVTPDGTLFIPGPIQLESGKNTTVVDLVKEETSPNSLQIMVLAVDYNTSSSLFQCAASNTVLLDIIEAIFESPNIELFGNGQVVYKEPSGGHTVNCHQDAAFFEFGGSGLSPISTLNYQVDTNLTLDNGPLYIWPGSHIGGFIEHQDTTSHLGLSTGEWHLDSGLVVEGEAGDSVMFHQHLVHASTANLSDKPRSTFINRYTRPEDPVIMPLATTVSNRREALSTVEACNKPERKRGYMLRGDRTFIDEQWNCCEKAEGQFH